MNYRKIAENLIEAENEKKAVGCFTDQYEQFDIQSGYTVQDEVVKIKLDSGHQVTAYKMGLTSQAKMKQMNINDPIYGYIFDYMHVKDKARIAVTDLIHPKVEAELAFILDEDIEGPDVTITEVLSKTKWIVPVLKIIDSRYENFKFKLPDVVADNTSASRVVLGSLLTPPSNLKLDSIGVTIEINEELQAHGLSSAVLGNPANSVATLAKMLWNDKKKKIKKDNMILTGGITEAVLLEKGDYVLAKFEGIGEVSFHVS